MIGSKKTILYVCLNLLLFDNSFGQLAACANVELGPDTTLSCTSSCITLDAQVNEVGQTNSYSVSSIDYTPPYPFNQGNPILVGYDDIWSEVIPLPFTFCFFGNTYDKIVIGANGVITFDTTLASPTGFNWFTATQCDWPFSQSIPNSSDLPYRNTINGAYHDINPAFLGGISIDTLGNYPCRTFVVNYNEIPHYDCSDITTTQQIVLYETTNIIEVYIQDKPTCSDWNNGNAVIGIQNATGTLGYTPPSRNTGPWATNNEAWRFTPDGSTAYTIEWLDNTGNSIGNHDTLVVCPTSSTNYSVNVTYDICNGSQVIVTDDINVSENTCVVSQCQPINNFSELGTIEGCCYYVSNDTMTWTNANELCSISGGDMVAINSQLELDSLNILLGNVSSPPFGSHAHWLGLEDGSNYWNNGDSLNLTNYDNSYSPLSDGNYMYIQTNGFWDNSDNNGTPVQEGIYAVMELCNNISGCTDSTALNYNPEATIDDGSCNFCNNDTSYTHVVACDSVLWNGNWYDSTGIYETTFTIDNTVSISPSLNEGKNWCFGWSAGLDFNTNIPTPVICSLSTDEGCSSISDSDGNLLFYTDGTIVFDKNNNWMPNGIGLTGHPSSTQSAIIVKKPESTTNYYIFTLDGIGSGFPIFWDGLYYSEVDMTLNGGLGDIVASTKNTLVVQHTAEKIAVVKHQNGTDFWVVVRLEDYYSQNSNTYHSYLLSSSGLNTTPVVSQVGPLYYHTLGYLKASPCGSKIAAANSREADVLSTNVTSDVNLFNFDNTSGILSNPMTFDFPFQSQIYAPYGIEFSPNSRYLYVSFYTTSLGITQFDIQSGSQSDIENSRVDITTNSYFAGGALQTGPDGKIYHARFGEYSIGVINNPNLGGVNCNYVENQIDLAPTMSQGGLPTFYNSMFFSSSSCDSTAILNLTINNSSSSTDTQVHCDQYTWIDGITYASSNDSATWILTNQYGCDSIVTLDLTITNSDTGTDTQVHCNQFTWIDGITYTSSNNSASWTLTNQYGCDSIVTLDLTIIDSNSGIDTQEHCNQYTWIDGVTYTSSNNSATWILTNQYGCDSIVTLDLTITNSNTGIDTQVHCNQFTWIDGVTYTSNNNSATWILTNQSGCDSIVTLDLTINNSNTGIDTQVHCDQYTWIDGVTYTSNNNSATWTLTNQSGCDSIVTLDLTINNSNTGIDTQVHCDQYTWIDGITYTSSNNNASWILTNQYGCDSIITLDLTINNYFINLNDTACGEYLWDGNIFTVSGSYSNTFTAINGCDSVVNMNLTIYQDSSVTLLNSCDSVQWNGIWYNNDTIVTTTGFSTSNSFGGSTSSGSANEGNIWHFGQNAGIDFNSGSAIAISGGQINTNEGCASICDVNGNLLFYTDGQNVYDVNHNLMPNGNGLLGNNSSSQSSIIVKLPTSSEIYYVFTVDGNSGITGDGLFYSVVDMTLNGGLGDIVPSQKNILLFSGGDEKVTAVKHQNGSDFWIIGRVVNTNTYNSYLLTSAGINTTAVSSSVGPTYSGLTIGYLKSNPNGDKLVATNYSGVPKINLFDFDNSTGILSNNQNFTNVPTQPTYGVEFSSNGNLLYISTVDGAPGQVYQYDMQAGTFADIDNSGIEIGTTNGTGGSLQLAPDGKIYHAQGIVMANNTLSVIENPDVVGVGCNYVLEGFNLEPSTSAVFGLPTFFSSIFVNLPSSCDSVATAIISINEPTSSTENITSCDTYTWNGNTYNSSGTYSFSTINNIGCDSTANLNLIINYSNSSSTDITACDNYFWNGEIYTVSGVYTFNTTTVDGCDSTATLNLTINNSSEYSEQVVSCDSYIWNDEIYTVSGQYIYNTTTVDGCDSTAILNLTINNSSTSTESIAACDNFEWNGIVYDQSGEYVYNTTTVDGCDSTATLMLTINSTSSSNHDVIACDSYIWNGEIYTVSGQYIYNTTTVDGCDSTATLNLTINNSNTSTTDISSCYGYDWNGITYNTSGTYNFLTSNSNGCDSTAILNLTINNTTSSTTDIISCEEYTWNGITYNTSGTYYWTGINSNGCDSIATLNLLINTPTTSTINVIACNSYSWNGTSHNTSGTYSWTGINSMGCDSIATLNLIINSSTTSTTNVSDCNSYFWNGTTYNTSGTYNWIGDNSMGCDSIATLNLLINSTNTSTTFASACNSYLWNGLTYNASGTYNWIGVSSNGCDSIVTLNLVINTPTSSTTDVSACNSYSWNGLTYNSSGIYNWLGFNSVGCDSIAYLNLSVYDENIHIPNTFTPNNDSKNEEFMSMPIELENYSMIIYNRWGQEIFISKNSTQGWDGTFKGKMCQDGVYLYKIGYLCSGDSRQKVGQIHLLK